MKNFKQSSVLGVALMIGAIVVNLGLLAVGVWVVVMVLKATGVLG